MVISTMTSPLVGLVIQLVFVSGSTSISLLRFNLISLSTVRPVVQLDYLALIWSWNQLANSMIEDLHIYDLHLLIILYNFWDKQSKLMKYSGVLLHGPVPLLKHQKVLFKMVIILSGHISVLKHILELCNCKVGQAPWSKYTPLVLPPSKSIPSQLMCKQLSPSSLCCHNLYLLQYPQNMAQPLHRL